MKAIQRLSALALGLVLGAPAGAQAPLLLDGTAFGGSRVFAEGYSPLGSPARFDQPQPQPAYCLSVVDGDQRSPHNASALTALDTPPGTPAQWQRLAEAPWALRHRSIAVAWLTHTANLSASREDLHSVLATGQLLDVRRTTVDRLTAGIGSTDQGSAMGLSLRAERWRQGGRTQAAGSPDPFAFDELSGTTTTLALDLGFGWEPIPGLRLGGTVDRLNQKHLWDVYERPQLRVGVQADLGAALRLAVESDVNAEARMPFPLPQRTAAVSLRIAAGPRATVLLGVERKKIGPASLDSVGVSLRYQFPSILVGFGFQAGQDRPMKGLMMVVN